MRVFSDLVETAGTDRSVFWYFKDINNDQKMPI